VQAAPPSTLAPAPTWPAIEAAQARNQRAQHRVVGLVIETRPDLITPAALIEFRRLGATKVQMGIQSLCAATLAANGRATTPAQIAAACALLRTFGFKIHVHMMLNLMGSTPQQDQREYRELVQSPSYSPDEVKLYPCVLVASAALTREAARGRWRPYSEEALVHVLVEDILATPAWVRVSRMIRDIATGDILAGNKKTNLRQLVEARVERLERAGRPVGEIRHREIVCAHVDAGELALKTLTYTTTAATEHFLQWVTPAGAIAGFLRLSLPTRETEALRNASLAAAGFPLPGLLAAPAEKDREAGTFAAAPAENHHEAAPPSQAPQPASTTNPQFAPNENTCSGTAAPRLAMIREVHVYGRTAELGEQGGGASGVEAQHRGLGKQLIQEAARQAREAGYQGLLVISSVGTREYYAHLGFLPAGLYQYLPLT
jgi:elongator complex protein 3